jgi:hypothetical protein
LKILFILSRTTQLLRISELANSPNVRYEIFFLPYIDYFQLRAISPDGQNREKVLSYKILFPESSIPHCQDFFKNQSWAVGYGITRDSYYQRWFVFDRFFSVDHIHTLINVVDILQNTTCEGEIWSDYAIITIYYITRIEIHIVLLT